LKRELAGNINKLYLIKIAKWFMLYMPIIVLFYQENGLAMYDVFLLQGIYSVAIVVLEIPSGYFADVWGRKSTMVIGAVFGIAGFTVYTVSHGFWGFLIAEMILGIGQSFISGSDSAMLYDTMLHEKKEKEYIKVEGRVISIGNFAETTAAIFGGLLAEVSLRTPFIAQVFVAAIALPAAILLVEPPSHARRKATFKEIVNIVRFSLLESKPLKFYIYLSAVIGTSTLSFAWFVQPYLHQQGYDPSEIGILWALLNLVVGITTLYAYKIEKRLGEVKTILLIVITIAVCYISAGLITSFIGISFLFIFYFARGVATPVLKDYINRITASEIRATVLSVRNFVIRFNFAIIGPFLGWYTDHYSLAQAFWLAGILFFVLSMFTMVPLFGMSRKD
jgi:MFS family permease